MVRQSRIRVTPPGPKARELLRRDESLISPSVIRPYPLVVESGEGCIVRDVDGNEFIDFNSGILCLNVGHSHPRIIRAIETQARKLLHYSYTDFYYEAILELGEKLCKITPGTFEKKIFYCNSGTESVEAAIKLARWHTRKQLFLGYISAFHGRTMGSLSLTSSKPAQRRHFFPVMPGVTQVPYPYCYRCPFKLSYPECNYWCVDFIEEWVLKKYVPPEDVAAFFVEPIQGEGGYVVPPPEYFRRLKKLTDKYGILIVDDEVQTGVGRTGKWFAIEHWGILPEMFCVAKAIASGIPLGVTVARAELMDWEGGTHATTLGGNPLAAAVALEVIDVIKDERLLENAAKQGNYILKRLKEMQRKHPILGDVRGKGLMIGVEIVKDPKTKTSGIEEAKEIVSRSFKRGLAMLTCGVSTIRVAPPLTITRDLVDEGLTIFEGCVKETEKEKA